MASLPSALIRGVDQLTFPRGCAEERAAKCSRAGSDYQAENFPTTGANF